MTISFRTVFSHLAERCARTAGSAYAFGSALILVLAWLVTGPIFHYSELWQIVINTVTTIITFLLVFLIQNAQNRDTAALHIKLDELIRVTTDAENSLLDLEKLTDVEIEAIAKRYLDMASLARAQLKKPNEKITAQEIPESTANLQ